MSQVLNANVLSTDLTVFFGTVRNFAFTPHFHDCYVLPLILDGAMGTRYDGRDHVFTPGRTDLIAPGTVHTGQTLDDTGWSYVSLFASSALIERLVEEEDIGPRHYSSRPMPFEDRQTVKALFEGREDTNPIDVAKTILAEKLQSVAKPSSSDGHLSAKQVSSIRDQLISDLDEPMSFDSLVTETGLSRTRLLRGFKQATGLSPLAWRRQYRITRAEEMLRAGLQAVDVSVALGFSDQAHFTRWFRRSLGITPALYAQQMRSSRSRPSMPL